MKKKLQIFILILIVTTSAFAAENAKTPNELDPSASVGEIGLATDGFKGGERGHLYQQFAITADTYNYFRVGFIQNKPLLNPSSPPGSLAKYQLIDSDPSNPTGKNKKFMTDGNKNLWVWHMIKNKVPVRIELSFGLFYRYDANDKPIKEKPYYAPYVKIYTGTDQPSIVAEGGWSVANNTATSSFTPSNMGRVNSDDTVTLYIIDEEAPLGSNLERNDAHKLVIESTYVAETATNPVEIDTYYAQMTLKVVVK